MGSYPNIFDSHLGLDLELAFSPSPPVDSRNEALERSDHRALVTTGSPVEQDCVLDENIAYLEALPEGKGRLVYKPARGIFDLWPRITGTLDNAPEYCWPESGANPVSAERMYHGAPGKLVLVARQLVRRASALIERSSSVETATLGAVLASDALELVGGRTPTTALEALALKHRFEVIAECQFVGVEHHVVIQERLDALSRETQVISSWFADEQKEKVALNGELNIVSDIITILRNYNKIDEDRICVNRARRLHNRLWLKESRLAFIKSPLVHYIDWLLDYFSIFIIAIGWWISILSLLFILAADNNCFSAAGGLVQAFSSFFSVGPPIDYPGHCDGTSWRMAIVTCLAIVSGAVHLGIFISHVYTVASRR